MITQTYDVTLITRPYDAVELESLFGDARTDERCCAETTPLQSRGRETTRLELPDIPPELAASLDPMQRL